MDKELSLLSAFIAYFLKMFMIKEKDIEKAGIQKVASSKVTCIQRCIMKTDLKFSVPGARNANGSLYSIRLKSSYQSSIITGLRLCHLWM